MSENQTSQDQNLENDDELLDVLTGVEGDQDLTLSEIKVKYPALKATKKAAALNELGLEAKPAATAKSPEVIAKEKVEKDAKDKADKAAKDKADKAAKVKELARKELDRKIKASQKEGLTLVYKDGKTEQVEANDFVPSNAEAHLYHVQLEQISFNPTNGKRLSSPYSQIFTAPEWAQFLKHGKGLGYAYRVLWNPAKFK